MTAQRIRWILVPALAVACKPKSAQPNASGATGAPPSTLGDRLAGEADGLGALFHLDVMRQLAVLLVAALLLTRVASALVRVASRLGIDSQRRFNWWEGGSRVLVGALVLYLVGSAVARAAPLLSAFGALALVVAGSWVFSAHLQNAVGGVGLLLKRKLRTGDRIQVGALDGVVRSVGLTQLQLVKADGSTVLVPNRLLNEAALTVAREKNSVPVRVRLRFENELSSSMLEQARRTALLSPYRAPKSSVEVSRDAADGCVLEVAVQVWAAAAARAATDHLESSLRVALPQEARPPPAKDSVLTAG